MNALIFSAEENAKLLEKQQGQHRLAPEELSDGRFFLTDDILTEVPFGLFGAALNDITYTTSSLEEIIPLIKHVSAQIP